MINVDFKSVVNYLEGPGVRNWQFRETGIKLINIKNLVDSSLDLDNTTNFLDQKEALSKYKHFLLSEGDFVMASSGVTWGKIAEVEQHHLPLCLNTSIIKLKPKGKDLDKRFLWHFIKSISFRKQIDKLITGSAQPNFGPSHLEKVKIPLPPLPVQQKIAAILDAADLHRRKTKTLIEKYDQLTQSIFLEMFGDPVRNEKGWEKVELSKLGAVVTGSTPPSSKEGMFGGEIPFVTPGDLGKNGSIKRTVTMEGAKNSRIVSKGSLLVCCIGATIGKTDIARADSAFNQQINAVDWNESIVPLYGFHSFGFLKSEVISRGISTTLPILKKSEFAKIKVAVPPLHLQKIFAQRVKLIEDQATKISSTILKSEELFNTLLQRAFKGELVS
jgi:type I restriction enzyme, S subunit